MNEWVWSNGGMILTGENWSTERKTLYSVGGRWMNEYGAMVVWYWQGKSEVLGEKHYTACVVDEWVSVEQWWNDTDRGKLKYWEKNIIQRGWQMNEYGGMVEWYWQGKTEELEETPTKIATVYSMNSTLPCMGLNPGFRGERPATIRLWYHPVITFCRGAHIPAATLPWQLHFMRWRLIFVATPLWACAVCTVF